MKTFKILLTSSISILGLLTLSSPAQAGYRCSTNSWGTTTCSGSINGQSVYSRTSTNSWGTSTTTGSIGGKSFSQRCSTNSWGTTSCY